jgi:hypothetical protein
MGHDLQKPLETVLDRLEQLPCTTLLPQNGEKNATVTAPAVSTTVSA